MLPSPCSDHWNWPSPTTSMMRMSVTTPHMPRQPFCQLITCQLLQPVSSALGMCPTI